MAVRAKQITFDEAVRRLMEDEGLDRTTAEARVLDAHGLALVLDVVNEPSSSSTRSSADHMGSVEERLAELHAELNNASQDR